MGKEINKTFGPAKDVLAEYYGACLRKLHPELSEDEIKQRIEEDLQRERIRTYIEGLWSMDKKIAQKYPHLSWTTWFDDFRPIS